MKRMAARVPRQIPIIAPAWIPPGWEWTFEISVGGTGELIGDIELWELEGLKEDGCIEGVVVVSDTGDEEKPLTLGDV